MKLLSGKIRCNYTGDDNHTACEFNDFFSNIGKLTTQHLTEPDEVLWIGACSIYEFKFGAVAESSVLKLLKSFGANSSLDILNIYCKLLKLSAECITPSLTHLFNLLVQGGDDWEYSGVTPA